MDGERSKDRTEHPLIVFLSAVLLLATPVALIYFALEFAPAGAGSGPVHLVGGLFPVTVSEDARMLVFVTLVAALGGFLAPEDWQSIYSGWFARRPLGHGLEKSTEDDRIVPAERVSVFRRLSGFMVRAAQGAVIGAVFYVLVRAAVVSPAAGVQAINPVGMQLLAFGVGLCSSNIIRNLTHLLTEIVSADGKVLLAISRLEDRFDAAFLEPPLIFFDGFVFARVVDSNSNELTLTTDKEESPHFIVEPGKDYRVVVGFAPGTTRNFSGIAERLSIPNGTRASLVTFDCVLDSDTLELSSDRSAVTFKPDESSPLLSFSFKVPRTTKQGDGSTQNEPRATGHDLYVEVVQKNRLLQSVPIQLKLRELQ